MPRALGHHSSCEARGEPAPILLSPFHTLRTGAGFTFSPNSTPRDFLCRRGFWRNPPKGVFVQDAEFLFRSDFVWALHKKSGLNTIHGNRILNKPPYLVVNCNFCAKPFVCKAGFWGTGRSIHVPVLDR